MKSQLHPYRCNLHSFSPPITPITKTGTQLINKNTINHLNFIQNSPERFLNRMNA
jgi:hypothetical protein